MRLSVVITVGACLIFLGCAEDSVVSEATTGNSEEDTSLPEGGESYSFPNSGTPLCASLDCDDGNPCTLNDCDDEKGCVTAPTENGTPCDDGESCTENDSCTNGACIGGPPADCEDRVCGLTDAGCDCGACPTGTGCSEEGLCLPIVKETDGDGIDDAQDNCPNANNPDQKDQDEDGTGDACDPDLDGDGINNDDDNCAALSNPEQVDSDGDGEGDACDEDTDGDGVLNESDNCPDTSNVGQADLDNDGIGDECDEDIDGDGVLNEDDEFPNDPSEQTDNDEDGIGDAADNCTDVANPDQANLDGDEWGDACDEDKDGDGVSNDADAFPEDDEETTDTDGDGTGDNADADDDNDGVEDDADCAPLDNAIFPGAEELCNGINDDCDEETDEGSCDDGLFCNGVESCDPVEGCQAGEPPLLDDGLECTQDSCDEETDTVLHTPSDEACDDENVCTDTVCDATAGCVTTANTATCDDNNACTLNDNCLDSACVGDIPPECDDGNLCTDDSCNSETGCIHTANSASCDDGDACTAEDTCEDTICVGGPGVDCDDSNVCTDDNCDSETGCGANMNTAQCDDGDACTTSDNCIDGNCIGDTPPDCNDDNQCTVDACDAATGCQNTAVADFTPCDDGNFCTDAEVCLSPPPMPVGDPGIITCGFGADIECDDGNPCTDDSCDPDSGCIHAANTASCDDGDACTSDDACQATNCVGGTVVNCDDGIECTADSCESDIGCIHSPDDALCASSEPCVTDSCDLSAGCTSTLTPDCCGNGLIENDEECDDGNVVEEDGCSSSCINDSPLGSIHCWGDPPGTFDKGQISDAPIDGQWKAVSAGYRHSCAIDAAGEISCWGSDSNGQVSNTPESSGWIDVVSGDGYSCAVSHNKSFQCWGKTSFTGTGIDVVTSGQDEVCALKENGEVVCKSVNDIFSPTFSVPTGEWKDLAIGITHGCALDGSGEITCWGNDNFGVTSQAPSNGTWTSLAAGYDFECAIDTNGNIECWGQDVQGQASGAPLTQGWVKVDGEDGHACAIHDLGVLMCWGQEKYTEDAPTWGHWTDIDTGNAHSCGIYQTVCGNESIEPSEECDDGNVVDGDGCSATCSLEALEPCEIPEGWAYIPAGTFTMGSPVTDSYADQDQSEFPQHQVTISSNYLMQKTEVTQYQWQSLMGNNPSNPGNCDSCPVDTVLWWEALAYCNALSAKEGFELCYELIGCNGEEPGNVMNCTDVNFSGVNCSGYRLPTEAEWEYAYRAGTTTRWYCGDEDECVEDIAWFNLPWPQSSQPVATKAPNNWGLFDMAGNVLEWCWDWWDKYGEEALINPIGPDTGTWRVNRGGMYSDWIKITRAASRNQYSPSTNSSFLGFRPVRTVGTCENEADEPSCGNNIVDSGEECDDGNVVDGDGCSATCLIEMSEATLNLEVEASYSIVKSVLATLEEKVVGLVFLTATNADDSIPNLLRVYILDSSTAPEWPEPILEAPATEVFLAQLGANQAVVFAAMKESGLNEYAILESDGTTQGFTPIPEVACCKYAIGNPVNGCPDQFVTCNQKSVSITELQMPFVAPEHVFLAPPCGLSFHYGLLKESTVGGIPLTSQKFPLIPCSFDQNYFPWGDKAVSNAKQVEWTNGGSGVGLVLSSEHTWSTGGTSSTFQGTCDCHIKGDGSLVSETDLNTSNLSFTPFLKPNTQVDSTSGKVAIAFNSSSSNHQLQYFEIAYSNNSSSYILEELWSGSFNSGKILGLDMLNDIDDAVALTAETQWPSGVACTDSTNPDTCAYSYISTVFRWNQSGIISATAIPIPLFANTTVKGDVALIPTDYIAALIYSGTKLQLNFLK